VRRILILHIHYWDKQSMQKIGEAFAVTKMTVSKRHKKILDKLRASVI
jgi:DNA-directed RNA polymerase specialized sigma subunit